MSEASFKYFEHISRVPGCPPASCLPRQITAYRLVRPPFEESSNFQPPAIISPKRKLKPHQICSAYALSLFDTEANCEAQYRYLEKVSQAIANTIGNWIASGQIDLPDGVASNPDHRGHFDLYEYSRCDLSCKFQMVRQIT